jgi:hypothetical protein
MLELRGLSFRRANKLRSKSRRKPQTHSRGKSDNIAKLSGKEMMTIVPNVKIPQELGGPEGKTSVNAENDVGEKAMASVPKKPA